MTDAKNTLRYRCLFLTLLLLAVYGNTLNHGFVWDDTDVIVTNPILEKLTNIPQFFLSEDKVEASSGYYRPITYVSFALDRAIWGVNPIGSNITNLLLQIAATLLFYRAVFALFGKERLAFIAALIFSLHPVAGETVNFHAGGRNTLLCAVFSLVSLLCHLKGKRAAAVFWCGAAVFSKEFGLLLPAVLYLHDRFIKGQKSRLASYTPYLIPIAAYFALRSFAVEKANLLTSLNRTDTLWLSPYLAIRYLTSMVNPFGMRVLYDVRPGIHAALACLTGTIALMVGIWYGLRRQKELALAIFWFLLFLLPVINIIVLPAASLMADRYAYFPLMGFSLGLAAAVCRAGKRYLLPGMLVLCTVFAAIDIRRNSYWADDFSFYSRMIRDAPEMALGYHDLGIWYFKHDDPDNAAKYLALASSKPDISARLLGAGAGALWESGRFDAAKRLLRRQQELEPGNPQPYLMLKMIYEREGNRTLAKSYGDRAHALFPGIENLMAQRSMSVTEQAEQFMAERSFERAGNLLREALAINPDYIPALIDMASSHAELGDQKKAVNCLERVVALDPLNATAHYNLSQVYRDQGKLALADAELKRFEAARPHAVPKKSHGEIPPNAGPRHPEEPSREAP